MSNEFLDPEKIVQTIDTLSSRIHERFPDSGLYQVCRRVHGLASGAQARAARIARPIVGLRVLAIVVVGLLVAAVPALLHRVEMPEGRIAATELIQALEAGMNDMVLIGAAIFFLVTLETRLRRRRALQAMREIRTVAHIIDMHQLTKDPDRMRRPELVTPSSPKHAYSRFEMGRYLDYCSELLALSAKVAAVYVERFDDSVAIDAANEVEQLCSGLSRKIWQKIMILQADG